MLNGGLRWFEGQYAIQNPLFGHLCTFICVSSGWRPAPSEIESFPFSWFVEMKFLLENLWHSPCSSFAPNTAHQKPMNCYCFSSLQQSHSKNSKMIAAADQVQQLDSIVGGMVEQRSLSSTSVLSRWEATVDFFLILIESALTAADRCDCVCKPFHIGLRTSSLLLDLLQDWSSNLQILEDGLVLNVCGLNQLLVPSSLQVCCIYCINYITIAYRITDLS